MKRIFASSVALAVILSSTIAVSTYSQSSGQPGDIQDGPAFRIDGQLVFIKNGTNSAIKMIQIEIADNEAARNQGLMWRQHMSEDDGMLFIFDKQEPLTFWMKNTYIPLDMVFADKAGKIVDIYQEATPLSEASIPSGKPAKYVIEVNGGFCATYGVGVGDKIEFER